MKPVWIAFPDIPWGSVGWRMGFGETYWYEWKAWYLALPIDQRVEYKAKWSEPEPWAGFYDFMEHGTTPRWLAELRQKLDEPQSLPDPSESEIADYYRVVWLMRHHLKRLSFPEVSSEQQRQERDEYSVEFYAEPNGAKWRVSGLNAGGFRMRRVPHDV
jgi:hypothetical protein